MVYFEVLVSLLVIVCSVLGLRERIETGMSFLATPFILGGRPAKINDFPYQVSLRKRGEPYGHGHIGAASILNERYLLTAAHCFAKPSVPNLYYVVAGSTVLSDGKTFEIEEISVHNNFCLSNPYQFDVAVIKLRDPLEFSGTMQPISLVPVGEEPPAGTDVIVAGWGRTIPGNKKPELDYSDLRKVELRIRDRASCSDCLGGAGKISAKVICAGSDSKEKTDASLGDSGGPLVDMKTCKQVGIVSFGSERADTRCPGAYTNLADEDVRKFIDEVLSS